MWPFYLANFLRLKKKIKAIGAQISQRPTVSTATGPFQYMVLGVVMVLAAVERGEKEDDENLMLVSETVLSGQFPFFSFHFD